MNKFIKSLIPPIALNIFKRIKSSKYGWQGNYKSWEEAQNTSTGYDSDEIIKKVRSSLLKVKNGEAVYERDSVIFDEIQYFCRFLYRIKFYYDIKSCIEKDKLSILLVLNVLQYMQKLYQLLVEAFNLANKFLATKFTIRLHATILYQFLKGLKSPNRTAEFVNYLNLPKLEKSNILYEDLSNQYLIVNEYEYSNVLIQVFQLRKLRLIENLTNHRNFMIDFSELGFLTVESMNVLNDFTEKIKVGTQNIAIEKYNELQSVFSERRM